MTTLQATENKVVILLGPPGAGKGSQALLIKEKMKIAHISTGDLLRENIKNQTELGKKAKVFMDAGQLVPDDLIFDMLFKRIESTDCKHGYLLDGFPRTLAQAETFQKKLPKSSRILAINLAVDDPILIERICERYICEKCQAPYHMRFSPSKVAGKCDQCSGNLYQRSDDKRDVVEQRLKVYHEQTAPLIDYYAKQKTLHRINSNASKDAILLQILQILSK